MPAAAVTPTGVRDGDRAVLAGLCARRGPAVLTYCERVASKERAVVATAEAFRRFRAAVVAASDPTELNPEALLISATRQSAAAHAPHPPEPPSVLRFAARRPATGWCGDTPALLAARADRQISTLDRARLEQHLAGCPACRGPRARFEAAERAYRDPPDTPLSLPVTAAIMAALATAAPMSAGEPIAARPESMPAPPSTEVGEMASTEDPHPPAPETPELPAEVPPQPTEIHALAPDVAEHPAVGASEVDEVSPAPAVETATFQPVPPPAPPPPAATPSALASLPDSVPPVAVEIPQSPAAIPEVPVDAPEFPADAPGRPVDAPEVPVDAPEVPVGAPEPPGLSVDAPDPPVESEPQDIDASTREHHLPELGDPVQGGELKALPARRRLALPSLGALRASSLPRLSLPSLRRRRSAPSHATPVITSPAPHQPVIRIAGSSPPSRLARLRPAVVLPVVLVVLAIVLALAIAGVFDAGDGSASPSSSSTSTKPSAGGKVAPAIVIPGADASAAAVEAAKARARARVKRAAHGTATAPGLVTTSPP